MVTADGTPQLAWVAELLRASRPERLEYPVWMTPEDASIKRALPLGLTAAEIGTKTPGRR